MVVRVRCLERCSKNSGAASASKEHGFKARWMQFHLHLPGGAWCDASSGPDTSCAPDRRTLSRRVDGGEHVFPCATNSFRGLASGLPRGMVAADREVGHSFGYLPCCRTSNPSPLFPRASPLKCDICSKPAIVHLTQIVNHKVHKVDLCEECAQAKGVTDPSGFSLADLLLKASLNPEPATISGVRCEQCGFTPVDFKKHGRFGCPACFDTFKGLVEPMLDSMHKGTAHTG